MRRIFMTAAAALLVANLSVGCASHTKTVRHETVEYPSDTTTTEAGDSPRVVERDTTTEEDESHSHGGVISTTVDFLGEVIAFPFRLIGGIINAIF